MCSSASEERLGYIDEAKCGEAFGSFDIYEWKALLQMVAGLEAIQVEHIQLKNINHLLLWQSFVCFTSIQGMSAQLASHAPIIHINCIRWCLQITLLFGQGCSMLVVRHANSIFRCLSP